MVGGSEDGELLLGPETLTIGRQALCNKHLVFALACTPVSARIPVMETPTAKLETLRSRNARGQRWPRVVVQFLIPVLAGCLSESPMSDRLPPDGAELPILRSWSRAHSHENRSMRLAIRNAADLSQIPLDEFDIDFSTEMALIVTLGRMPSDRYQVQISGVHRDRGRLIADVEVIQPPRNAPLVVASPYCVAIVPRCDLPVDGFSVRAPARSRSWSQSELGPPQ